MLNDIYNKKIIELAGNIPRLGRLADPDACATAHSKLCGSTVKVDLKMQDGVVTDFAHDVKACALGQASSSIMARHVVGSNATELRELRETVRKMLKENGAPPQGKWADIAVLEPVRDYKARHASTLLTFDAVVDAIGQIEAKAAGAKLATAQSYPSFGLPITPPALRADPPRKGREKKQWLAFDLRSLGRVVDRRLTGWGDASLKLLPVRHRSRAACGRLCLGGFGAGREPSSFLDASVRSRHDPELLSTTHCRRQRPTASWHRRPHPSVTRLVRRSSSADS